MKPLYVRDYMTSPAASISKGARLLEAALTMRRSGFRHLPIVEENEKLVGIITDRDIQRFAPSLLGNISQEEYNQIFEETPLEKVMTKNLFTVTADTPIVDAASILHDKKLGCVPVVEGERLVGIITVTDMLRLLNDLLSGQTDPLA